MTSASLPTAILRPAFRLLLTIALCAAPNLASATPFTNSAAITINDRPNGGAPAAASLYPSNITVSGLTGTVTAVSVTLNSASILRPRDTDVLLVAPSGQAFVIMGDAGGLTAISGVNITLDDAAAAFLPGDSTGMTAGTITTGSYKPTDGYFSAATEPDSFPAPAPTTGIEIPGPQASATFGSVFTGINPNGVWKLYVVDDSFGGTPPGSIGGGWTLNVTAQAAAIATTTAVSGAPNPAFSNQAVAITATVSSGSGTPTGSVTFREGVTTLACGTVALNGSGQAVCNMPAGSISEGDHTIAATYNPTGAFTTSNSSYSQRINNTTVVTGNEFCNTGTITTIDNPSATTPYASNIFVTGLSGTVTKVTLSLKNINAPRPRDLDILLVGPGGQKFIPLSDVADLTAASNITLVLDDAAAAPLPTGTGTVLASGTFRPTDFAFGAEVDAFPAPAPVAPYLSPAPTGSSTFANVFNGSSPNGTWSLYVRDDSVGGGDSTIANGWCLTFSTSATEAATTTALASSQNPSLTGSAVTFTATVTRTSNATAVTSGTVTFREGATVLMANAPVNGSGKATFTTSTLAEGSHALTAEYSGVPGSFALSLGTLTQVVNNQTVVSGNQFCNPGAITFDDDGTDTTTPYGSNISVTGLFGNITKVVVTLNNMTMPRPRDVDLLLVGPGGQKFIPMSDVGDLTAANGITLILDDAAGSAIPTGGSSVVPSGTFRPTDVNSGADTFPAPAPSGPYNSPAPAGVATFATVFNGSTPNGTWSLYLIDDSNGGGNTTIASGWCLTLTTDAAPPAITSANNTIFTAGTAGTFNVTTTGNPPPTLSLTGSLPGGVTFGAGTLAGTPTAFGTFPLTFTASNGVGSSAVQNFTLTVNPSAQSVQSGGKIEVQAGGGYQISFIGNPGQQYTVQFRDDLVAGSWQFLSTQVANANGMLLIPTNPPAGTAKRFYRLFVP